MNAPVPAAADGRTPGQPEDGADSVLSAAEIARIDRAIAKYPSDQRQSAVMAALAIAQEARGWLSTGVMDAVARQIGMPAVADSLLQNTPCACRSWSARFSAAFLASPTVAPA